MTEFNTCDLCTEMFPTSELYWITSEDFVPREGEVVPEEAFQFYDALCEGCYHRVLDMGVPTYMALIKLWSEEEDQDKKDHLMVMIEQLVIKALPHGSGFDYDYELSHIQKNGLWVFHTYYTCYDESGGRDGYLEVNFRVDFLKQDLRVYLKGKENYKYLLKDYIYETLYYNLFEKEN